MNLEFKGTCHLCGKYGHKQNKCPEMNLSEEGKGKKNFWHIQCGKVRCKAANCWKHETNIDNMPKNWKEKEERHKGRSFKLKGLVGMYQNKCN